MKEISVIIPTYIHKERKNNLLVLLSSLQIEKQLEYIKEIIIVDNGCTLLKSDFYINNPIVKIVEEPIVGLNNARNCGIKNSTGSVVAFLDDDVIVSETWAKGIINFYSLKNIFCVGGPVIFDTGNTNLPNWMSEYFTRFLFPPSLPKYSGILQPPFYLIGANMSFKKEVFNRFGLFDSELDRKGRNLLSNGDTDFIIRLPKESIWYSTQAKVTGIIKTERFTRLFMIRRLFWQGISDNIMVGKNGALNFYDRDEIFLSKKLLNVFVDKISRFKFFELFCAIVRILGFISGYLYKKRRGVV